MPGQQQEKLRGPEQSPPAPHPALPGAGLEKPQARQQQPSTQHRHRRVVIGIANPGIGNADGQARITQGRGETDAPGTQ